MIDGTEKPKIRSKFAKRTARYNEFGSIANLMKEINATFTKKQNLTRRHEESYSQTRSSVPPKNPLTNLLFKS